MIAPIGKSGFSCSMTLTIRLEESVITPLGVLTVSVVIKCDHLAIAGSSVKLPFDDETVVLDIPDFET